jgi:hypothetical protein
MLKNLKRQLWRCRHGWEGIIIKIEYENVNWIQLAQAKSPVLDFHKHGDEPSNSIKGGCIP